MDIRCCVRSAVGGIAFILIAVSFLNPGGPARAAAHLDPVAAFELLRSYYASDATPLEAQVTARQELGDTIRETLQFRGFDRQMVTAYLARPKGAAKPPVVIALHGMSQSKDQWWSKGGPWSFLSRHRAVLLGAGIAVLALDARRHGPRIGPNDYADPMRYVRENQVEAVRKIVSQSALDVRRAIDYLETRGDVDASRLGLIGYSLGAMSGWIATAVDPRVDRSLLIAMPILPLSQGQSQSFTSPWNYLPGLTDRPVMLLAALEDTFYTVDQMSRLYEGIASEEKGLKWVPGGHDMPPSTAQLSRKWFAGKL